MSKEKNTSEETDPQINIEYVNRDMFSLVVISMFVVVLVLLHIFAP